VGFQGLLMEKLLDVVKNNDIKVMRVKLKGTKEPDRPEGSR